MKRFRWQSTDRGAVGNAVALALGGTAAAGLLIGGLLGFQVETAQEPRVILLREMRERPADRPEQLHRDIAPALREREVLGEDPRGIIRRPGFRRHRRGQREEEGQGAAE